MISDHFLIPKKTIHSGISQILTNSLNLLREAIVLTEKFSISYHLLGLYTFAVEEYGKALILEECLNQKGDDCRVPKSIFIGKKAHSMKFRKALENLPNDCKFTQIQTESYVNSSNKPRKITTKKGHEIEIGAGHAIVLTEQALTDFQARLNCFYLEWDSSKSNWKKFPLVDFISIEKSIHNFEQILTKKLKSYQDDTKRTQKPL